MIEWKIEREVNQISNNEPEDIFDVFCIFISGGCPDTFNNYVDYLQGKETLNEGMDTHKIFSLIPNQDKEEWLDLLSEYPEIEEEFLFEIGKTMIERGLI